MKYLIIGVVTLMLSLLIYRVLMAVGIEHFNMYDTKYVSSTTKSDETHAEQLQEIGKSMYLVYCSSCHGANGKGNNGKAHNHTKRIAKKSVLDVIKNGSNNFKSIYPSGMPAGLIKGDDIEKVATFVANGMVGDKPKAWSICASCHDESGNGIPFVAPNIHSYSDELVSTVLKNGKKGVIGTMPFFGDRLSDIQMKALANHIRSIAE